MKTKIFGIGLAKTGTTSLHFALEQLGFRSIHAASLLSNLIADEIRADHLLLATVEEAFDSFIDWPISYLYAPLDARFPDSKFILTVRDPRERYRSALSHVEVDRTRLINGLSHAWITLESEEQFIAETERHEAAVRAYFANRPDKLLVLNIIEGEGWEQLCAFLKVPTPPEPFPYHKAFGSHHTHFERTSEAPLSPSTDDGWPPNEISAYDLILGRYHGLPDAAAMIARLRPEGDECNYMCERMRRGWPSLLANEQNLDWRAEPGYYEWYLRLRHNNPLFYPLRRAVARYDLCLARKMDDQERRSFVDGFAIITSSICVQIGRASCRERV